MNYFKDEELACKCGCNLIIKPPETLFRLNWARHVAGVKFKVNSATRCHTHNHAEGGKDSSDHLTGDGFDIECLSSYNRHRILTGAIAAGCTRIGIGKTFIHLGFNVTNPQGVVWLYN